MEDDLDGIIYNIRACVQSSKAPVPLRSLSRDYETIVGSDIPYRRFNYATLEEFLRSLPSLRVTGSGGQALVEAASIGASSHVTSLISKQKSTAKKHASFPPRKSYPPNFSFRGRGGRGRGRGRGRGSYDSRPYIPRDNSTRDYAARDEPTRDYYDRDQPTRDYSDRDQPTRDYAARDQPTRDYSDLNESWDYSGESQSSRDYSQANSVPRRYSPGFQSRPETTQLRGGPITVKVDGEDKRQVSWKKPELPPRLQKLRQQNANSQQNAEVSPAPSISPVSQGFDSSLFTDQSDSASSSASIISPLGPSQLIARAKKQADKAKLEQQYRDSTNFLLQPSSQGTNDLIADFARLSHHDSDAMALGNHWTSLNGHRQIPEDPSALLIPHLENLLPEPDHNVVTNNIAILLRYCISRNWPVPTYTVVQPKGPKAFHKVTYLAYVKVNGDGDNNFKIGSYPEEHENITLVKGHAAKNALKKILAEESKKVKADKVISSDSNIICSRISDIVAGASNGLFSKSVEDEYINRHNELLPSDWLQTVGCWPTLSVESTVSSTIILPRVPAAIEPVQFDPTVAPPPLPVEGLGDADGMEDVYITHATSVNNVWFRIIGKDYSDEYEVLVKLMDSYYSGAGARELALTLEVGQYYAAHTLDTWFRVCVTEVDDSSQTVVAWLVDHGDNERFAFGSLYRLVPQFCQLPQQAVLCVLEGLESFADDEFASVIVSTSELLIGQSLIAKISSKDTESGSVKAILYDTSGDDDIVVNERIKDEIIEKAQPKLPLEGFAKEVAIGDVSKKGEVYIMFNGPSFDRIAEIIYSLDLDKISEHKLTSFKHISMNKLYLAKYSKDENWYRAVVIATPSIQHNKIPVRFVDFGNTESVSISDMVDLENLPPILRKLPAQAVKVALHNLPIESLTNPEVARLHSLLLDEDKVVLIKTISLKADPPIVEIFTKEADTAGLVSVNSTIELQRKLYRNEENRNSLNLAGSDANLNHFINNQDDFVLKCPDFSDSDFQAVLVVLAAHPGNFIFQPVKYAKELKKLRGQMEAYYDAGALPELSADRVVKNKLFAARYIDDLWYRVVVTDAPMGSRVPVRLCDFGDVTCVTISSLRELAPEFHIYPFMAVKGKLAGVVPRHKDWSVEDCIRFQKLVVDQILAGIVVSIEGNNENPMEMIVTLTLVDTSSEKDQSVAEILLREQRAVKEV